MTTTSLWRDELRNPRDLMSHPRNPRLHSPEQIDQIRASIREFGFTNPALITEDGRIIAGHGRTIAAEAEDLSAIPCRVRVASSPLTESQELALLVADNRIPENAGWDEALLASVVGDLQRSSYDVDLLGFSREQISAMVAEAHEPSRAPPAQYNPALDIVPDVRKAVVSALGDVWKLGQHRILCGDSTDPELVARFLGSAVGGLPLICADPPYGMGKESSGIENDNLYGGELVGFQMAWWRAWRPFLADNASAYIWGNPEELWRLWYGGLADSERLALRNEIVWNKGAGFGMNSDLLRCFSVSTERCLFFMLGQQGFGNVNVEDFWEGFEAIRAELEAEAKGAGFTPADVKRITGVGMWGHWFTKSQWTFIPERHYLALREASGGKRFARPYSELRRAYDGKMHGSAEDRLSPKHEFNAQRAYFDNVHDVMTEVWDFPRVFGDERQGHATPKPVAMIARCIKSSSPAGAIVLEPFAGSGSTLIAAEATGRICYTAEIGPAYVDVTVRRWQQMTGERAIRERDGVAFDTAEMVSGEAAIA